MFCTDCHRDSDMYLWMTNGDHCPRCSYPLVPDQNFPPPTREMYTVGTYFELPIRNEAVLLTLQVRVHQISFLNEELRMVTFRTVTGTAPESEFQLMLDAQDTIGYSVGNILLMTMK